MMQKRFAGMANRAFRIVAACAVVMMLAGICSCGGKASAQGGSTASAAGAQKAETKAEKKAGDMSIDELKKLPPSPESDFLVESIDDNFTAVKVTKYKGSDQVVVIPATIQGLPVKWIGAGSRGGSGSIFSGDNVRDNVVAVVTPEGMSVIGEEASHGCPNLSVAVISEGVTCILEGAFVNCKNLSSVVLPSTLKYIGKRAFQAPYTDEGKLASIELPAGLLYIGDNAFFGTGLTSVKLPEGLVCIGEGLLNTRI